MSPAIWILLLTPSAYAQPFEIEGHLRAAQAAEQAKDYERAGDEYRQILDRNPRLALIRQSMALTLHLRNQFPEAIREFELAIATDSTLWGSHLFLGVALYKTNQFPRAAAALRKSMALNQQAEPEGRFWLGACLAALGQPKEAVREFEHAARMRPDIEVLYQLAQAHQAAAASDFGRIGQAHPGAAAVRLLQAERYLSEDRRDLAAIEYRAAIALRPDLAGSIPALPASGGASETPARSAADARALAELAQLYADLGMTEKAAALGRAKVAAPSARGRAEPGAREALQLLESGRACEATAPLERLHSSRSRDWITLLYARALAECNKPDEAREALAKILGRDAPHPDALWLSGKCHQRAAANWLERMIAANPGSYRVKQMKGERFEEATEYGKALESYQQALAANAELSGIRYAIGNVYRKQRNHAEAIRWLEEELKRNPHHGLSHLRLGSIYLEEPAGAETAVKHLEAALAARTGSNLVLLELGRAYLAVSRNAEALATLRKFAAAEPSNDRVHFLLSQVYRKSGRAAEADAELAKYQALSRDRLTKVQEEVRGLTSDAKK